MAKQVIVQVHTLGGGCFMAESFEMTSGWEEQVRDYINAKKAVMDCTHAMMYINGTSRQRRIDL